MRQDTTTVVSGAAGNNVAQNSNVATVALPGPGRYKIWGNCRHTLADGIKLTSPIALTIASGPNDTAIIGPMVVDVSAQSNLTAQLAVATGASDTASITLYAEKVNH